MVTPHDMDSSQTFPVSNVGIPLTGQSQTLTLGAIKDLMVSILALCYRHLLVPGRAGDKEVSGWGDTGTLVCESDVSLSDAILKVVQPNFPASFAEESGELNCDPFLSSRRSSSAYWIIDPVDGSGDRKYGEESSRSSMGYTSLASFYSGGLVHWGIVVRPAHKEALIIGDFDKLFLYRLTPSLILEDGPACLVDRESCSPIQDSQSSIFRINRRSAYPDTNFESDFYRRFNELGEGRFAIEENDTGGAGDALARLVLGELSIVYSGRKCDWKVWDLFPFLPVLRHLQASVTDYYGNPLDESKLQCADLVFDKGVLVSLADSTTTLAFRNLILSEQQQASRQGQRLFYDPRD